MSYAAIYLNVNSTQLQKSNIDLIAEEKEKCSKHTSTKKEYERNTVKYTEKYLQNFKNKRLTENECINRE